MFKRTRTSAFTALLMVLGGLAIAACGSSSSSSSASSSGASSTSTTTSTSTPGGARRGLFTDLTTTQRSCLKSHGVTLGTGAAGGARPGGGPGTFTRPSGTPPAGASTTGGYGGAGGGFAPGGFGGATGHSSKYATAFKACGVTIKNHFGGAFAGGAGGGAARPGEAVKPTAAALKTFVACVDKNGYALKDDELNTAGTGSILPKSLETNTSFLNAAEPCERDLFARPAPAGTGGGGGTAGAGPGA